jgi:prevent-host-death family protein
MSIPTRNRSGRVKGRAGSWAVAEAKARLSEVIDCTVSDGAQTITRHGREVAVVVSIEEWKRRTKRQGNLAQFFAASPLRDAGITIGRRKDGPNPWRSQQ